MARKPIILVNDIKEQFASEWFGRDDFDVWPLWLDDILSGVTRLDWYGQREQQVPLSMSKLIKIFTTLDEISTENIMELFGMKNAMARKYAQAARIAYPLLKRSMNDDTIKNTRYPRMSIVSYEHGLAKGYSKKWEEEDEES